MTRKEFLRNAAAAFSVMPLAALVNSCAPSAPVVRGTLRGRTMVIPGAALPDLNVPYSYAKVLLPEESRVFILFKSPPGPLVAVLATCTHNGCEVRKTRIGFECPCHGSEFALNGDVTRGPAPEPLDVFEVKTINGNYEFEIL